MKLNKLFLVGLSLAALMGCKEKKSVQVECKEWTAQSIQDTTSSDPYALKNVKRCGNLNIWAGPYPKSLNMWLDYNAFSAEVTQSLFYPLFTLHPESSEPVGLVASSWEISEDQKEFVFKINPLAKWNDGKSITAVDVQYYYDVIMDKKNMTPIFKVDAKRFERPEIIDSLTVKIVAKEFHWKNFLDLSSFMPLPKHALEGKDFNKIHYDFPVSSGPYEMGELKKERFLKMKRNTDWWGDALLFNKNKYNFASLKYRFMEDRTKALEALKKGDFDYLEVFTSSIWAKQTDFDQVQKNQIVKQQVYNKSPIGFQGLAMNLRKDKFKDKRVRLALAHLLNRKQMNDKLMYGAYFLLNSYYPDLYPNNVNPNKELVKFDPDKARALLKEVGYVVNDQGVLQKDGKPFEIVFYSAASDLRHLTIYLEDLKKVGIQAKIEKMTWSTLRKKLDDHDFDMYWAAWGASRF
jgi:microcin C transport system substrate-binding protein